MSRPRNDEGRRGVKNALLTYLTVTLLSTGAALCLCGALVDRRGWAVPVILYCAVTALLCLLYGAFVRGKCSFRARFVLWFAVALGVIAWGVMGGGPIHDVVQLARVAVISVVSDSGVASVYAQRAQIYLSVLVTALLSYFASDEEFNPAAVLFMMVTVPLCASFDRDMALRLMPGVAGLLMLLASHGGRRVGAAVLAVILALTGFFLLPQNGATAKPLADTASDIREFVEDYLMYDDVRSSFSLASEGYLPLESRLGGEAAPSDRSVMEVTTDRTVRLRATTHNMYTGVMWHDTLSNRRYLYISPNFLSLRDALFDVSLPRAYAREPEETTVKIHMLTDATTTLYTPQRIRQIEVNSDRMVLYYNTSSEIFITRDLQTGDEYSVDYIPYRVGDRATEMLVRAGAAENDPHYGEIAAQYLTVPEYIQSGIHSLVFSAVGEANTPYQAAYNIERFLATNYRYDLHIGTPPDNVDFITWFLLGEEQAGYCTYFASAMTLMCRMAGIPARYVTGYLVPRSESGVTVVTGENAHAWTEVYLNGFGWLPFDATPEHDDDRGETPPSTPPQNTSTPTPSPTPTPTPTPEPSDRPPQDDAPTPTPTPEPESDPDVTPSPEPGDPPGAPNDPDHDFPWLWLLLPLLIALVVLRYLFTEPCRRAARRPADAAVVYYGAVCDTLEMRKITRYDDETLHEFCERAEHKGMPMPFAPLTNAVSSLVYGRAARFTAEQAENFKSLYLACRKALNPFARAALVIKRMLTFRRKGM